MNQLSLLLDNGYFQNAVFFILDIVVLSIILPIIIRTQELKKWQPVRDKIFVYSKDYLIEVLTLYNNAVAEVSNTIWAIRTHRGDREKILLSLQSLVESKHFNSESIEEKLKAIEQIYVNKIQLCAPALNSEIIISINTFLDTTSESAQAVLDVIRQFNSRADLILFSYRRNTEYVEIFTEHKVDSKPADTFDTCVRSLFSIPHGRSKLERVRDLDIHARLQKLHVQIILDEMWSQIQKLKKRTYPDATN